MTSETNVVSIAAWSARRALGERSVLAIVPGDGRDQPLGARPPGPASSAVGAGHHTLPGNACRVIQFECPGMGTGHGDPADPPTTPTSGAAA